MRKNKGKNNKIKQRIENIFVKVLAFIIFFSPVVFYCIACFIASFVK